MEVFTHVFRQRQRNGLKRSNETNAGPQSVNNRTLEPTKSCRLPSQPQRKSNNNIYFAQLRPKVENQFLEFADRYEINLNCSTAFRKNEITVKYSEIDNQIKIIGFQSNKIGDRILVDRKILRCFSLPEDIDANEIRSVMKQSNQLKIIIPKCKIDGNSDGENDSCHECMESEESNDAFN